MHGQRSVIIAVLTHFYEIRAMAGSDRSSSSQSSSTTSSSDSSKESVDLLQELTNEMRIAVAEVEQEVKQFFTRHYFKNLYIVRLNFNPATTTATRELCVCFARRTGRRSEPPGVDSSRPGS